ncbi:FG-GAP-like repeat-containing protein [Parasedimentitalea marina]|uniref:FG-GAP-like repeat-containing protein n=1 Tax=Parasedimentitalea marina TaxID=2483033 RepID=UPI001EE8C89F|nr:FG-GAP-like repeat-containing protein [Parasedimentitalea marina]
MSGAIQLEDPLSFEAWFPLEADMVLWQRVFYSTLNWLHTNQQGMTFGILFAAGFMTLLAYLPRKSFQGGFANAMLGLGIGAPLGVCANCAAPIGRGVYAAGMRAETALAAMVASPTLNVVVLSMLFSLMPFYMAVTKLGLSLFVILVAVPLLCRWLPQVQLGASQDIGGKIQAEVQPPKRTSQSPAWNSPALAAVQPDESFIAAILGVARTYLTHLWYIIRLTVPMMLLAGLLGALVATLFPQDLVVDLGFGILALTALTLIALFLPVPMGFDVVLCGALFAAGLAHGYVMAALFTLGSFSVYSAMIINQMLGWRAATLMAAAIATLGFGAGISAHYYHSWQSQRALEHLLQGDLAPGLGAPAPQGVFFGAAQAATLPQSAAADTPPITVVPQPLTSPSPPADTLFTRVEATTFGIDKPVEFSMRDMWPPFWEGRSLATGDIDNDGDLDLAVASSEVGLYLYTNDGAGNFSRLPLDLTPLEGAPIFNAVLVDIDNDGWQDLFLASYLRGNYWWRNNAGHFDPEALRRVAGNPQTPLAMALSFADLDRDGFLDLALGNWAAGWYRRIPGEESRNRLLFNPDGQLDGTRFTDLPGLPGETLSLLFTDFDQDGLSDLIVGNDFDIPDYFTGATGRAGSA